MIYFCFAFNKYKEEEEEKQLSFQSVFKKHLHKYNCDVAIHVDFDVTLTSFDIIHALNTHLMALFHYSTRHLHNSNGISLFDFVTCISLLFLRFSFSVCVCVCIFNVNKINFY